MAGLTVTEKQHWKDRIAARINKRIEAIKANHAGVFRKLSKTVAEKAAGQLGITKLTAEIEKLEQEIVAAREKLVRLELKRARTAGVDVDAEATNYTYSIHNAYDALLASTVKALEDKVWQNVPAGRQVLELEAEKDNLLDTVWLATSSQQIKELWSSVEALLGDETTPLQKKAMKIAPVVD